MYYSLYLPLTEKISQSINVLKKYVLLIQSREIKDNYIIYKLISQKLVVEFIIIDILCPTIHISLVYLVYVPI